VIHVALPYGDASGAAGAVVRAEAPPREWTTATELRILLPQGDRARPENTRLDPDTYPYLQLADTLIAVARAGRLCRLTLLFPAPPVPKILALANTLAGAVAGHGVTVHPVWAWNAGGGAEPRGGEPFARLQYEIEPSQWLPPDPVIALLRHDTAVWGRVLPPRGGRKTPE
jgi:hypothetical protein